METRVPLLSTSSTTSKPLVLTLLVVQFGNLSNINNLSKKQ